MATYSRRIDEGEAPLSVATLVERIALMPLTTPIEFLQRVQHVVAGRRARPWVGMIAVPVALIPAFFAAQWWMVLALTAVAWWWAPHEWGWEWLVAFATGVVGTEWTLIGAVAMAEFPNDRLFVDGSWIAAALLIAAISAYNRRHAAAEATAL